MTSPTDSTGAGSNTTPSRPRCTASRYDDLIPDASEEGDQAWRAEAGQFLLAAGAIGTGAQLTPEDAVTLDCTIEAATQELASIDMARAEYMVTAMQYSGPAAFLAVAARTVLLDPAAARPT